jgi:hypothetical protein
MIGFPDLHELLTARDLAVLIAFLDEIVEAIDSRDRAAIAPLLEDPLATHLPREVREELALFAAQRGGFRAPIRFLRFRFRMQQLAVAEEPFEGPQLELDLGQGAGWRARYVDEAFDEESGSENWESGIES